jgi:DNA-directed RNA polymerase subunit RPC12/RpoP
MKKLKGIEITQINVVNGKICVYDDKGNFYYLKSSELIKMVNDFNFEISQPKKHKYLIVNLNCENEYMCQNCGGGFSRDEMDFDVNDVDLCKNCNYKSFNDSPYGDD